MSLEEIADNSRTDKNTTHSYLSLYQNLLISKKETAKNVLEVGIQTGGSIKLWSDFFTNANVYGLDPLYSSVELASLGFKEIKNLKEMDVIILHTAHEEFREIDFSSFSRIKIILDGRNFYGINDFPGELQIIKI